MISFSFKLGILPLSTLALSLLCKGESIEFFGIICELWLLCFVSLNWSPLLEAIVNYGSCLIGISWLWIYGSPIEICCELFFLKSRFFLSYWILVSTEVLVRTIVFLWELWVDSNLAFGVLWFDAFPRSIDKWATVRCTPLWVEFPLNEEYLFGIEVFPSAWGGASFPIFKLALARGLVFFWAKLVFLWTVSLLSLPVLFSCVYSLTFMLGILDYL